MEMKMGHCRMEGAYEVAEIMFSDEGKLSEWLDAGDSWPHTLPATLAGWYLYEPKPAAEDITGIPKIELRGRWWVITFRIRRGKDMLAAFMNQHEMPDVNFDFEDDGQCSGLWLRCAGCMKHINLPWDSFGHMGGELVRAQVAPSDEKETACTGAVRRTGGSGDGGSDAQRGEGSVGAESVQS